MLSVHTAWHAVGALQVLGHLVFSLTWSSTYCHSLKENKIKREILMVDVIYPLPLCRSSCIIICYTFNKVKLLNFTVSKNDQVLYPLIQWDSLFLLSDIMLWHWTSSKAELIQAARSHDSESVSFIDCWGNLHHAACARPCPTLCNPTVCSCQLPLSMELSRQGYWRELPFVPPGGLPDPGIEPMSLASPALAGGFFTTVPPGKPRVNLLYLLTQKNSLFQNSLMLNI